LVILCICREPRRRDVDGITILPVKELLAVLWAGAYT
jgi:hypothetical protein